MKDRGPIQKRPDVTSYDEKLHALHPLEEFSVDAFRPDAAHPIELCRFVFALSVIYNDYNDLDLALTLLNLKKPGGPGAISRSWGLFGGLSLHLAKARVAIAHELLNVIRDNELLVRGPAFAELLSKLNREQREAWTEVTDAAKGNAHDTPLGKYLARCRDKAAGHYDVKALYNAYYASFEFDATSRPLISRGNCLLETRFYFADRAVENIVIGSDIVSSKEILFTEENIYSSINLALFLLVTRFINSRSAFKPADEGAPVPKPYFT